MTTHDKLMLVLMSEYVILAITAYCCRQHGKCVYWIGALIISIGVLMQR